jgi:hypothetical protein
MKQVIAIVLVIAVVVASVAGVVALVATDSPSAATIGDTKVSRTDLEDELRELAENETLKRTIERAQAPALSDNEGSVTGDIAAGWLALVVSQTVAQREVERRGLEETAADRERGRTLAAESVGGTNVFRDLPDWFRERLVDRWSAVAVLERALLDDPSSELQAAIDEQCPSGRYVSHILVESDAEAQAVEDELAAGADFAEVAERSSFDQGSAAQGGALGCIDGQDFVEPFATVAATQPIGEVSEPFTTEFGTHLVLVSDEPPRSELRRAAIEEILGRARGEDVDINERFGLWDCRNGQVLPAHTPVTPPGCADD